MSTSITPLVAAAIGVAGTIAGAFLANALGLLKDRWLKKDELERNARYLAIRVVCSLDPFVISCCNVANDWGMEDQEGITQPEYKTPDLSYPIDVDWKSIPHSLMYRILSLPNEIDVADRVIRSTDEYSSPPDYQEFFEERNSQYADLGLTALKLTKELRSSYGIPNVELWYDPEEALQSAKNKITGMQSTRSSPPIALDQ